MELVPFIGKALVVFIQGELMLMRTFLTHVLLMPLLLVLFLFPHLVLIKVNGLSPLPEPLPVFKGHMNSAEKNITFFDHVKRIMSFSLAVYGITAFLAAQFPSIVYPGPYTGVEMTRPPWIFLPFYALENIFGISVLLIAPFVILVAIMVILFVDQKPPFSKVHRAILWLYGAVLLFMVVSIIIVGLRPPFAHIIG